MGGLGDNGNSQRPFLTLKCFFLLLLQERKGLECVIEELSFSSIIGHQGRSLITSVANLV